MTDTMQGVEAVIKTDVLGRVRTPVERRQRLLGYYSRNLTNGKIPKSRLPHGAKATLRVRRQVAS